MDHDHNDHSHASRKAHPGDKSSYEDSVVVMDCTPFWRRLGITWPQCARVWFVKDICGIICAIFTWLLLLYAEFVILFVMLLPAPDQIHSIINGVIFQFFTCLAFASHLKAMLTDPGAVPRGNATKDNIAKLGLRDGQVVFKCPKCVSIKPDRAHHCSVCRRCIKKMDHHCPWVNNCIGENNQKFFVLFTLYICVISIHALYMSIHHFIVCVREDWHQCTVYSPAATTIFLIFLLFEGLLFGLFTAIMCGTQMSGICTDETGIENLKKDCPTWERRTWWLSIKSVFGHPFSIRWFSPFHLPSFHESDIFLYTVWCCDKTFTLKTAVYVIWILVNSAIVHVDKIVWRKYTSVL